MRIVNREEFLKLPTPFMYIKCDKYGNIEEDLCINVDNYSTIDWTYNSCVFEPDFKDSEERFFKFDEMLEDSSLNIPVCNDNTTRDSLFSNKEQLFIIYSKEDFELFVETMQEYLQIYGSKNNKEVKIK